MDFSLVQVVTFVLKRLYLGMHMHAYMHAITLSEKKESKAFTVTGKG